MSLSTFLSYPVLFCLVLYCLVLIYPVLYCPILSSPVLSSPVLSCPVLSYSISVLLLSSILPLVFFPLLSLNSIFQILSWSFLSYSLLFSCLSIDLVSLYLILFHKSLGTIEDSSQLNFIYRGFVRLLNNVHLSESSYLPFSVARMSVEQVGEEEYSAGDFRMGFMCAVCCVVCVFACGEWFLDLSYTLMLSILHLRIHENFYSSFTIIENQWTKLMDFMKVIASLYSLQYSYFTFLSCSSK